MIEPGDNGRVTRTPVWPLLLWVVALAGFVVMAAFASARDRFAGDLWLAGQVQGIDGRVFAEALDYTAEFGELPLMVIVAVAGAAAVWRAAGWGDAVLLVLTLGSRLANSVAKEIIGRPRPSPSLVHVDSQPSSFSFPSGHADTVIVLFGFIFYMAAVHVKDVRIRRTLQAACVWVIVGTGLQRVYVGDHWPSDVLGGYYLGALILAGLVGFRLLVMPRLKRVT